jgi:hypothetical protein
MRRRTFIVGVPLALLAVLPWGGSASPRRSGPLPQADLHANTAWPAGQLSELQVYPS